ncbi:hypothetical protein HJG60_008543 [Phyllostomus discolor]|uniref:Uncharacterized protein n=1 Tax=Phyllostomus discolor TaxID=89673 RepID=A0A833YZ57_9CHIR|nr:hypothetical protein HJG60_008543 [Phyllostomus discolor]
MENRSQEHPAVGAERPVGTVPAVSQGGTGSRTPIAPESEGCAAAPALLGAERSGGSSVSPQNTTDSSTGGVLPRKPGRGPRSESSTHNLTQTRQTWWRHLVNHYKGTGKLSLLQLWLLFLSSPLTLEP